MRRVLVTVLGLLVRATTLASQTLPVPDVPKPAPSTTAPDDAPSHALDVAAPAGERRWQYALGAGIGWDSNVDFLVPHGPHAVALTPRGSLARVASSRHARVSASLSGGWTSYPRQDGLHRSYADLDVDASYRRSPRTQWRASAAYGWGYSDSSRILLEQGVALPVVKTRTRASTLGLTRHVGARTSLQIEGRYYRVDFDGGLIGGASTRGTIGCERQLDARGTAAIVYALESVRAERADRSYVTHFGSLQWTRSLSPRSALLLEAGGSYTPAATRAALERKQSFFGGASLTRNVRRSSLTLFLRREVTPAFGIGVSRLELRAGLGARIPIARAWALRLAASHVHPDTPGAERPYPPSDDAVVALARRLAGHVDVSAEARYRRRAVTAAAPQIEAFQAGLFVSLVP